MNRSKKWQKFYQWYSLISCLLVVLVSVLVVIGGRGPADNEVLFTVALNLGTALLAATVTGGDLFLWIISVVVWFCRKDSTKLWKVLVWGLAMLAMKFLNFMMVFGLSGGEM